MIDFKLVFKVLFGIVGLVLATAVFAQDYPTRPIKIVVPYPAAGAPDLVPRILQEKVSTALGQPLVIENKPGAGGGLAGNYTASAPPDGYTLMMADTSVMIIAPHLVKNLGYEPMKAFAPIALLARMPYVLAASTKSSTITSLDDLIRQAKQKPGGITYGTPGFATNHHLVMEAFSSAAGIRLTHIPYIGGAAVTRALLAGEIQVAMTSLASLGSSVDAPEIRVLAVTTPSRFPLRPDIPAVSETFPGFEFTSEAGIVAPAGVPAPIINKLTTAFKAAVEAPETADRLKAIVMVPAYLDPNQYADKLKSDRARLEKVIKSIDIEKNN